MNSQRELFSLSDPKCVELNSVGSLCQLSNLKSSVVHSQLGIHIDKLEMGSHEDLNEDDH